MIVVRNERMHFDSKERTSTYYNEICARLNTAILQIQNISDSSQEFKRIQQSFVDALTAQLEHASQEANATLNSTEWDKLVIAFFGETNAGKSTIIETFRILFDETERRKNIHASFFRKLKNAYYDLPREGHGRAYEIFIECIKLFDVRKWFRHIEYAVDGIIVGDGRHDFTKIYKEYEMNISGKPFVLIDVPGIEGNEDDYKDEIKTALSKAHCVFYVHGHDKPTDSATAEKIKKYLRNWVKVYTIYNKKGSADAYDTPEERINLVTDDDRKICVGIEKSFSDILGDSYGGNTMTQGFLALASHAHFSPKREDLIRKQNILLSFFNSREELYQFSGFDSVVSLVNEKASNYTNEIYEANKDKLIALSKHAIFAIDDELDNQKDTIEKYRSILNNYRREVLTCYNSASHRIEIQLREKCDSEFRKLKEYVFSIISDDDVEKKERITTHVNTASRNLREGVFHIVKAENEELNKRLIECGRKLEGLPIGILNFGYLNNNSPNININISDFLEHLEISFGDVIDTLFSVGSTALTGFAVGGPIGAAIGAGLGILGKWLFSDGGVGKAKEDARKKIEEAFSIVWNDIQKNVVDKIKNGFDKQARMTSAEVNDALSNIIRLENAINESKKRILDFENKMKTEQYGNIKE